MTEKKRIYLSPPHMGGEELEFVKEAFETNWISTVGPHIKTFEDELAAYNKIDHCAVLSSGTAAIHLALIILEVERGDEVICQSFTFAGSCNPIVYQGATPVFVDSEKETWNMDPSLMDEAIKHRIKVTGKKPKAIIVVHLYGMPAKMDEIMSIARQYEIPVIEDAAEALGSEYMGRKAGTTGDIGVYSFNGNKIITTAGGGAIVSNNEDWIRRARFLATQARDPASHYEHSEIGYNYRLSNVCAAIGQGQLKVLDQRIAQRRANFEYYRKELRSIKGLRFLPEPEGCYSNRWLTTVVLDNTESQSPLTKEVIMSRFEDQSIECRPFWKPMHLQPVYSKVPQYANGVSSQLFRDGLCLPSGTQMHKEDFKRIMDILNQKSGY